MQIAFHVIGHDINILVVVCAEDVLELDNVLVSTQLLQEHDFAKGSLRVGSVLERIVTFFQGHDTPCFLIDRFPHNAST